MIIKRAIGKISSIITNTISYLAKTKAKKEVLLEIYKNINDDGNFQKFYAKYKNTVYSDYKYAKLEIREIYSKLLSNREETLLIEIERISLLEKGTDAPYTSMILAVIIALLPNICLGMINLVLPINSKMNVLLLMVINIFILFSYSKLILQFNHKAWINSICGSVLKEMKEEIDENNSAIFEEVAVTTNSKNNKLNNKENIYCKIKKYFKGIDIYEEMCKIDSYKGNLNDLKIRYILQAKNSKSRENTFKTVLISTIITILLSIITMATTELIRVNDWTVDSVKNTYDIKKELIINDKDKSRTEKESELKELIENLYLDSDEDNNKKDGLISQKLNFTQEVIDIVFKSFIVLLIIDFIFYFLITCMYCKANKYETVVIYIEDKQKNI